MVDFTLFCKKDIGLIKSAGMFYPKYLTQVRCFIIVIFLLTTQYQITYAQQDSTENAELLRESLERERQDRKETRRKKFLATLPKNHNPKTASLLALIPGVGQIYNRRYWKLPIVYGGIGALGYFMVSNYIDYNCFGQAYLHKVDLDPNTNYTCPQAPDADAASLKIYRDNSRESAEYFLLGFAFFYGLTIIDAFVDAHLMHFDISDDLSMRIQPSLEYNFVTQSMVPGIGLSLLPRVKTKKNVFLEF